VRTRFPVRFLILALAVTFLLTATIIVAQQGQTNTPAAGQGAQNAAGAGRGAAAGQRAPNPLLSQPAPRLPDGTINLGRVSGEKGIWNLPYIQNMLGTQYFVGAPQAQRGGGAAGGRGGGGGGGGGGAGRGGSPTEPWVPFQPWAAAVYNYNSLNLSKYDPEGYCLPPGGPRMYGTPYPMEIIQQPELKRIIMIFEGGTHVWREIYMDGRPHPNAETIKGETWLGHSVGRWEGDTLVVDVVGFNEGTWLDYYGHPHTTMLHVVEKFSRPNKGTLRYEATIEDPGAYTRPFTVAWDIPWNATAELQEYICQENNSYLNTLTDDFGEPIFGKK